MLSSHLRLGLPSGLLPAGFPNKTLYAPTACVTSTPVRALTFLQRSSRGTLFFKNRQVLRPIDPRGQGHVSSRRRDSITH